jgi:hypothetical protein
MRVPQVTERIKEAPVQALRGILSGIGQVLLFTDKMRNKTPENAEATATAEAPASAEASEAAPAAAEAETPAAAAASAAPAETVPGTASAAEEAPAAEAAPAAHEAPAVVAEEAAPKATATKARRPRKPQDLDKTGNVKVLTEEEVAPAAAASAEATVPVEAPAAADVATAEAPAAAAEAPVAAEGPASPGADLPMPTYNDLTVASIRARLRNLTVAQVSTLAEYEKAHAARAEVITMFERRIAKLEAEG